MHNEPTTALRIVLLEDNASDAELIQLRLTQHGMQIACHVVSTEVAYRQVLMQVPDLVLADYTLPGFDGLAALRILRELHPDVPFIFVSGSLGEERAIEALKSGATDYVLKDRLQRLPAVAQRALDEARERRERRTAQAALEAQRVLLAALIDNLPDLVYAIDQEQRLTVVNRALLEYLQQPKLSLLGQKLSQFSRGDLAEEQDQQDRAVLENGRAVADLEHAAMGQDGEVRWYITSKIPLRDPLSGAVMGLVCTSRDITARKELEQEILEISNREQRRLGSDLHDGLGQELTGLSLLLKGLEMQLSREAPAYLPQTSKINALLARTIQSTRSLARGLAPVNLERGGGLPEALRHLAARCGDMYGFECIFENAAQRLPDLDESSATHLYRIAQEATTNAARYAQAQHMHIQLRTTTRKLFLEIADDGVGLSTGLASRPPGMGLKIMEYRARMMGGTLAFEEPGRGTKVTFSCALQLLKKNRQRAASS
jgi:two-component system sensor histidine kinase UhpB